MVGKFSIDEKLDILFNPRGNTGYENMMDP